MHSNADFFVKFGDFLVSWLLVTGQPFFPHSPLDSRLYRSRLYWSVELPSRNIKGQFLIVIVCMVVNKNDIWPFANDARKATLFPIGPVETERYGHPSV